eukprot:TRINITY_DN33229_c0_g1_i1.p1 TRINITY_DN33229_c0_g1~~TRINITY_DN33229_c0_g1_i1.p1  ORF type:complete len:771 (+),score=197.23 TRINITY_DN33229_c0_g1_i1:40-2352(+)
MSHSAAVPYFPAQRLAAWAGQQGDGAERMLSGASMAPLRGSATDALRSSAGTVSPLTPGPAAFSLGVNREPMHASRSLTPTRSTVPFRQFTSGSMSSTPGSSSPCKGGGDSFYPTSAAAARNDASQSKSPTPARDTTRYPSSGGLFAPSVRPSRLTAPASFTGPGLAYDSGRGKSQSPQPTTRPMQTAALEAKFKDIVEEQLLRLTSTLESAMEKRFVELESRLKGCKPPSPARRPGGTSASTPPKGGEGISKVEESNMLQKLSDRLYAENVASLIGNATEQVKAAEASSRQALESAAARHKEDLLSGTDKVIQEQRHALSEQLQDHLKQSEKQVEEGLNRLRNHLASVSEQELEKVRQQAEDGKKTLQRLNEELKASVASATADVGPADKKASGAVTDLTARVEEQRQQLADLRQQFIAYAAAGAPLHKQAEAPELSASKPLEMQQDDLSQLSQMLQELKVASQQAEAQLTESSAAQTQARLAADHSSELVSCLKQASASLQKSRERLSASVDEVKQQAELGRAHHKRSQEDLDKAQAAADHVLSQLRAEMDQQRTCIQGMTAIASEVKDVDNQAKEQLETSQSLRKECSALVSRALTSATALRAERAANQDTDEELKSAAMLVQSGLASTEPSGTEATVPDPSSTRTEPARRPGGGRALKVSDMPAALPEPEVQGDQDGSQRLLDVARIRRLMEIVRHAMETDLSGQFARYLKTRTPEPSQAQASTEGEDKATEMRAQEEQQVGRASVIDPELYKFWAAVVTAALEIK